MRHAGGDFRPRASQVARRGGGGGDRLIHRYADQHRGRLWRHRLSDQAQRRLVDSARPPPSPRHISTPCTSRTPPTTTTHACALFGKKKLGAGHDRDPCARQEPFRSACDQHMCSFHRKRARPKAGQTADDNKKITIECLTQVIRFQM